MALDNKRAGLGDDRLFTCCGPADELIGMPVDFLGDGPIDQVDGEDHSTGIALGG